MGQTKLVTELYVAGLCDMCKERIEKAAKSVRGVYLADWNPTTKKLKIEFDNRQTSTQKIQIAIAKVGHDTETAKADDSTYNALPDCCKYRP